MPDLRSPGQEPTGALYGMVNMLQQLSQKIDFDHSACVFDAWGKTFRHELYPSYKAQRPAMPSDLVAQITPVHRLVATMGWPVMTLPHVEADDVIGTLTKQATALGWQVIIATSDKDFAQLVNPQVSLINTMHAEQLDEAGIEKKFGILPEQIVDYLTLIGDTADNIPGVPQCGPKTAIKWLKTYGNLQGIIDSAACIEGAVGNALRKTLTQLPLFQQLITIQCDIDMSAVLPHGMDSLHRQSPDYKALATLFQQHGFQSLWAKILPPAQAIAHATAIPPKSYQCILTQEALSALLTELMQADLVAFDIESTSLNPLSAQLVGMSFSYRAHEAYYLPLMHQYTDAPPQLALNGALNQLKPWLESPLQKKVGQNLKYDRHVLANHGITLQGITEDTLLASYVLESHLPHNLDALAQRHLHYQTIPYEAVCGKGAKQIAFSAVPIDRATAYAAEDADITLQLCHIFQPKLSAMQQALYRNIELPISAILFTMERNGVLIDKTQLALQSHELGAQMLDLEKQIHDLAQQPFNINSPKQLQVILFDKLGIATTGLKKTPTGDYSTNESALEKLALDYPIAQRILAYRTLAKIKSTYTDKLPLLIHPKTGRIHTHYAQAVVVTGRLASHDPNLQNIPVKTAAGRRVREAFIAPDGFFIVSADYSQIELRIMAHLSEDPNLCEAFIREQDIHEATASEILGIPVASVTKAQRHYAKSINFGLIYGMGAYGLAQQLHIEQAQAKQFIDRYFMRYPKVALYMEKTKKQAATHGYVDTLFGRRIYQTHVDSANYNRRTRAERAAINAPIQGTAADLMKLAMIAVQQWLQNHHMRSRLIMQVHDELVMEVPEAELAVMQHILPQLFAGVAQLSIPLVAQVGIGNNWEAAH